MPDSRSAKLAKERLSDDAASADATARPVAGESTPVVEASTAEIDDSAALSGEESSTASNDEVADAEARAEEQSAAVPPLPAHDGASRKMRSPDTVLEEHRQSIAGILKALTDSLAPPVNPDGGEPGESLRRSLIGQRIGNYEIMSALSSGGMGDVFEATHTLLQRKVAIKVLRPEHCADHALVHRFFNEARAANSIRHPNIVEVVDVGMLPGGLPYIAMECLEGETLAERLKREGPLDIERAADFAAQAAGALRAAHKLGIVHRDLKPDNLFIVEDPRVEGHELVKLLDFGIAKLRDDKLSNVQTNAGSILGTPPYMSPEQCRGVPDAVDHRSDIYALGVILFEMLCGAPPFVAEGVGDVMVMHLSSPPPLPTWRRKEIPARIEQTILRALEKNPDHRIPTMADFIFALGNGPTPVPYILTPTGLTSDVAVQALLAQQASGNVDAHRPGSTSPQLANPRRASGDVHEDAVANGIPALHSEPRRKVLWASVAGAVSAAGALLLGWFTLVDPPPETVQATAQNLVNLERVEVSGNTATTTGLLAAEQPDEERTQADTEEHAEEALMSIGQPSLAQPSASGTLAVAEGTAPAEPQAGASQATASQTAPSHNALDGESAQLELTAPRTPVLDSQAQGAADKSMPAVRARQGVMPISRPRQQATERYVNAAPAGGAEPSRVGRPSESGATVSSAEGTANPSVAPSGSTSPPVVPGPKPVETAIGAVPPTPQPATVEYGLLNFDSAPWARVTLNGRVLGTTPLRQVRLPAGTHHLQLDNRELGLAMTYKVDIVAGKTVSKFAGLE